MRLSIIELHHLIWIGVLIYLLNSDPIFDVTGWTVLGIILLFWFTGGCTIALEDWLTDRRCRRPE